MDNIKEKKKLVVPTEHIGSRLDKYIDVSFPEISRTLIQRLIQDRLVLVNNKPSKTGQKLKKNDKITVLIPDLKPPEIKPENIELDVAFEDKDLIVVNKPQGMVTHPASGHFEGTLVNALLAHCKSSLSGINGITRPGIVHRLDKETSGLIIACKNDKSHNAIAKQIKDRKIAKYYLAIVHGSVKYGKGVINKPIGRHKVQRHKMAVVPGGKEAITHWKVLKTLDKYTFLELSLETGRTHQIRVHLSSIGHPIVGDKTYGKKSERNLNFKSSILNPQSSMMLHACKLEFIHPTKGTQINLETSMPKRFSDFFKDIK